MALRPNAVLSLLIHEVSKSQTTTHHSRYDSSGRVIGSSQSPLPWNTQHTHKKPKSMLGSDSNPQSQKASGRRPAPLTAPSIWQTMASISDLKYSHNTTSGLFDLSKFVVGIHIIYRIRSHNVIILNNCLLVMSVMADEWN